MARITLLVLVVLSMQAFSCSEKTPMPEYPECIDDIISQTLQKDPENPPKEIWQWVNGANVYYYVTSDCCDQYNFLLNTKCEEVCAPDGGITGNGDGKCPDFQGDVIKTLLWKDNR